jgi:ubiquitin-like modifier-activating enzyme ATG7
VVARSLLGWGVRNITLVDSGRVSYSNPARQCLFEYEDCVNKRFMAEAAAERLRRIFPDVNANGVVLSIPMPGHPLCWTRFELMLVVCYTDDSLQHEEDRDFHALRELVIQSDVVFALTDNKEARWLPTAMCAAENKILINAALGFAI